MRVRAWSWCAVCLAVLLHLGESPAYGTRAPRLRRLVVIGDSLLAGFSSGGLVAVGRAGQVDSTPAFVARRGRVRLPQPLMTRPGTPPQLRVVDANANGRLDPGEVRPRSTGRLGFRADPDRRVRNLAVPGEDSASVFDGIAPAPMARRILSGNASGREDLKFLILGLPLRAKRVSQVSRARALRPSFLMVWLGNNDLLPMAIETNPAAVTLSASEFGTRFRRLLGALADTGAGMAVANLPDPTGIAALRRAAGEVTACRAADGSIRSVGPDDLLSVDLDPALLPVPSCLKVLDAEERAAVRARVAAFNAEIAAAAAATEGTRGVPIALVDLAGRFDQLTAAGVDLNGDGSPDLTTRYLGGIFSLDGIHPTRTGNALIANAFIEAINARFGEAIPPVNVARVATRDALAHSQFRPAGEPPFGLIDDSRSDSVEAFFDVTFGRMRDGAHELRNDLRRELFGVGRDIGLPGLEFMRSSEA